jgi:translation initiation factor IF-3
LTTDKKIRVNDQIKVARVLLIDAEGEQVGIVPVAEALQVARDSGLDLVEVSPNTDPPVCRVLDYGKYLFDLRKRKGNAKKKQKKMQIKEIKFRPTTEDGDYQVKFRSIKRFLEEGDKVKISMRFRGREVLHQEIGMRLMLRLQADTQGLGTVEHMPRMEGRLMLMLLGPVKK